MRPRTAKARPKRPATTFNRFSIPASVAIYGASTRAGAPGNTAVIRAGQGAQEAGRRVYPINPKYDEVAGFQGLCLDRGLCPRSRTW